MDTPNINNALPLRLTPSTLTEERVRTLYRSIPLSLGITFILVLLLTVSHRNIIGQGELITWNIFMICAMVLRTIGWLIWRNAEASFSTQYWLKSFRAGALIAGSAWGSASYFMFADYSPTYQALLAFTLAGVVSGSLTSLAIDKFSAVGFVALAIIPISIRIHIEQGQTAIAMSLMVALFIIFVLAAAQRARQQLEKSFAQKTRLIEWGNERLQQQQISKMISQAQALFITENNNDNTFEHLLSDIIDHTASQYGFIAEVGYENETTPFLTMLATSNIAWHNNSQTVYNYDHSKDIKLNNLNTLFGAALTSGKGIISNNPAGDMRAGVVPKDHNSIASFLGIPIFNQTQQVAMLSLANKTGGYSEADIEYLKPITQLIAQFMLAIKHRRQHLMDEENIKRHAKHTQAILDGAFDGIITIDAQGVIASFNHSAEMIFGYRAEYIIGKNLRQLMPRQNPIENLHDHLGIGQELIGLRKSGKEFEMELALSAIDDDGATSYVGVIRDISDRKHTDKLKNEFIATVSHELRTPLTSISASLAIIDSGMLGTLPDKVKNLIEIAKQNSFRLQNLINDLLDMDKLLSNNIELHYSNFDAAELVQKTITENKYIADKHHVKFNIVSAEIGCTITADNIRTQQVLTHLLSNAAKFSNAHTAVDIAISKHQNLIKISVTDHGIGIADEAKENIFKCFTQGDSSNTRQKDGSGIGLSISKGLIEKMGGKIGFTSILGQGSSFYFELPKASY